MVILKNTLSLNYVKIPSEAYVLLKYTKSMKSLCRRSEKSGSSQALMESRATMLQLTHLLQHGVQTHARAYEDGTFSAHTCLLSLVTLVALHRLNFQSSLS